MSVINLN
jgi:hypothetical protein